MKAGHSNTIFSVRDIVSGTDGSVLQSYDYRENGEKTASTSFQSDKTWVGGLSVNDDTADSGLYLMGHRHFDSTQGRFLSRDPIGFAGGLNLYSYGNSPVQMVDPEGMYGWRDGVLDVIKGIGKGMEWGGYMMTGAGLIMEAGGTGTMGGGLAVASTGVGAPAGGAMVAGGAATAATGWGLTVTGAATSAFGLAIQMAVGGAPCGGTSGGNPALPGDPYHPQSVAERIRPRYKANPKHAVPRPGVSPEPGDVLSAYARSIRSKGRTWWSKTRSGFYRFSDTNERVSQAVWNLRTTCQPDGLGRYPQRSFRHGDYGGAAVAGWSRDRHSGPRPSDNAVANRLHITR